jgi:DNA-binding transcriptional LysR family regulator
VTNQVDAALRACEDGLGIGMFLSYQVAPAVSERKLRYVLTDFEREPVPVQGDLSHRAAAFEHRTCVRRFRRAAGCAPCASIDSLSLRLLTDQLTKTCP